MSKLPIIRAAAVQAEPIILNLDATVAKACDLIREAAQSGAKLVVFPKMFIPTFVNGSIWGRGLSMWGSKKARSAFVRLWENSVEIGDASTEKLCQAARENGVTVAMGLNEKVSGGRTLYNTILYIGEDGAILGKHRKLVPTNHERMVHGFGDGSTLKVFETAAGRIGGLICWENWMPLARYALYAQGEQIHVAPTAFDDEMGVVNARNTAFEGGVFVVSVCIVMRKASYPPDFEFDQRTGCRRRVHQRRRKLHHRAGRARARRTAVETGRHSLCRSRPKRDASSRPATRCCRTLLSIRSPWIAFQYKRADASFGRVAAQPIVSACNRYLERRFLPGTLHVLRDGARRL